MNIVDLRNALNKIIEDGYGDLDFECSVDMSADEDECFFVSELYELVFLGVYSFDNLKNLIIALNKSEVLEEKMTKFEESDEELWSTEVWLKTMMWYLKTEMFMFTGRLNK